MPRLELTRRPILITGGSRGIGRAVAMELARRGAWPFLVARGREALEVTRVEVRDRFPEARCEVHVADVTDRAAMAKAASAMRDAMGGIGGVVCNAGFAVPETFERTPVDVFERTVAVNYLGTVWTVRGASPYLGPGSFVTLVSSVAAFVPPYGYTSYAGPKAGLVAFAEALRQEMTPRGVRVSVLCPPDTRTPGLEEENRTKPPVTRRLSASAGILEPEEVARRYVRALERGRFLITVGARSALIYRLKGWFPELTRGAMDRLVARILRSQERE